jgi:hypothetical protein
MELFGIACSIPTAFVAVVVYSFALRWVVRRQPWVARVFVPASLLVLAGLAVEWLLLATIGAVRSRGIVGPVFYPAHLAVFFLSVPAAATVLVVKKDGTRLGSPFVVGLVCAVLALPVVLTQYGVTEALYGIDSTGGPYGAQ